MPAPSGGSSGLKNFGQWLKGILAVIGGTWIICIIAGFFGSIMMNCGRVVYVPVPVASEPKGDYARQGNPPVIFDGSGAGGGGTPMLQPVRVIPYDVIEAHEYGLRRRGILPPVCVPQQNPQPRRW